MLSVFNYNAGKGDCIRIRYKGTSGDFHNIIIDSGVLHFGTKFASICKEVEEKNESIDVIIISHVDVDHLGGLLYNLRNGMNFSVKEVWMNHGEKKNDVNVELSVKQNEELFTRLNKLGILIRPVMQGMKYEIDGAIFNILWPNVSILNKLYEKNTSNVLLRRKSDYGYLFSELMDMQIKEKDVSRNNHASVIVEMKYQEAKILFTGDAWSEDILNSIGQQTYDMIKLPHHGSVRNLSEKWGETIRCNNFMICTDGIMHPDKHTIAKLLKWYDKLTIYGSTNWWEKMLMNEKMDIREKIKFEKGEYVWKIQKKI